jgi:hypothetical protein
MDTQLAVRIDTWSTFSFYVLPVHLKSCPSGIKQYEVVIMQLRNILQYLDCVCYSRWQAINSFSRWESIIPRCQQNVWVGIGILSTKWSEIPDTSYGISNAIIYEYHITWTNKTTSYITDWEWTKSCQKMWEELNRSMQDPSDIHQLWTGILHKISTVLP